MQTVELPAIESNNWLIHARYSRKEFDICKLLIEEEMERSRGFNEYASYVQGLILRHEGKIQESLECFQKCRLLNPTNVENIKQIGKSLFLMGHHQRAVEAFLRAEKAAKSPDCNIYYNLGECYTRLWMLGKARENLRRAVQLGRTEESYLELARLFVLENDINSALEIYNASFELFPTSSEVSTALGNLYMKIGEHQKAFDKLGHAIALDPKNTKPLLTMASIIQDCEEFDVALSKYKLAGQALPESIAVWNNMGMCFFGKGKYVAAISCLKRANYLDPLDWRTLYNLGLVHINTKQYTSAFHFLSSAIKLQNKHAPSFMLLAVVLQKLGDIENAFKCFEKGIKLEPEDIGIRINFASYLYNQGQNDTALDQLNIAQRLITQQEDVDPQIIDAIKKLTNTMTKNLLSNPAQEAEEADAGDAGGDEVKRDEQEEREKEMEGETSLNHNDDGSLV